MNAKEFREFLDDRIDDWHEGRTIVPQIHDYLRFTSEEYIEWVLTGKLPIGIMARWGIKETV